MTKFCQTITHCKSIFLIIFFRGLKVLIILKEDFFMHQVYLFVRGPLALISFIVFVIGIIYQVIWFFNHTKKQEIPKKFRSTSIKKRK